MLDALAYPHIFDAVLSYSGWDALLSLRPTCTSVCARVDAILAQHIAFTPEGCYAVATHGVSPAAPLPPRPAKILAEKLYELELKPRPGRPAKRIKVGAEQVRTLLKILAAGPSDEWDVVVHPVEEEDDEDGCFPTQQGSALRRLPVARARRGADGDDNDRRARYLAAIAHTATLDSHMQGLAIYPSGRMALAAELPRVQTVRCHGAAVYNAIPTTLVVFAHAQPGFQKPPRLRAGVPAIKAGVGRVVLNVRVPPGGGSARVDTLVLPPSVGEVVVLVGEGGERVDSAVDTPLRLLDHLVQGLVPKLLSVRYTLVSAEGWDAAWVHEASAAGSSGATKKSSMPQRVAGLIRNQVDNYGGSRGWTPEMMAAAIANVEFVPLGAYRARVGEEAFRLETVA
ncbi:uncharacterized protein LOC62_03G003877 [Vanrija pseudolonga]|uniref:Uncharacterized protein n=1 Tax=Vanrija pseudolonga TaxID=143232 RepID=A0AAF0Y567_9TREE|nr:hypothetical protein LOC62_03G003877 [Vanrija pseudolonga]